MLWFFYGNPHEPRLLCPAGFSLGMPPAKRPPSCGGPPAPDAGTEDEEDAFPILLGAPIAPLLPLGFASTTGILRSFVSAFFSLFPAWICFKSSLEAMDIERGVEAEDCSVRCYRTCAHKHR